MGEGLQHDESCTGWSSVEIHLFYINDDWINTIVKAKHTNQVYI